MRLKLQGCVLTRVNATLQFERVDGSKSDRLTILEVVNRDDLEKENNKGEKVISIRDLLFLKATTAVLYEIINGWTRLAIFVLGTVAIGEQELRRWGDTVLLHNRLIVFKYLIHNQDNFNKIRPTCSKILTWKRVNKSSISEKTKHFLAKNWFRDTMT